MEAVLFVRKDGSTPLIKPTLKLRAYAVNLRYSSTV
jgi:hypothetical protein